MQKHRCRDVPRFFMKWNYKSFLCFTSEMVTKLCTTSWCKWIEILYTQKNFEWKRKIVDTNIVQHISCVFLIPLHNGSIYSMKRVYSPFKWFGGPLFFHGSHMIEPGSFFGSIVTSPYASSSELTYFDIFGFISPSASFDSTYRKSSCQSEKCIVWDEAQS